MELVVPPQSEYSTQHVLKETSKETVGDVSTRQK